jgi:hypothetical protein
LAVLPLSRSWKEISSTGTNHSTTKEHEKEISRAKANETAFCNLAKLVWLAMAVIVELK